VVNTIPHTNTEIRAHVGTEQTQRYTATPQSLTTSVVLLIAKKNSVALVLKRTIPTEPPPLVGEDSADFSG
jgi:hypothetical protein